jgi:hypothetical protein
MCHRFNLRTRLLITVALLCATGATSHVYAAAKVYTCVTANGRTLTSDRPIVECMDREQRILGPDGTQQGVVPPSLTADERAERENRERQLAAERQLKAEAVKRDRALMLRYPDAESHQKARDAALTNLQIAMRTSELRQRELVNERKPLLSEAEFYAGKALPGKLREQLDANDAAMNAQRDAQANLKGELERINNSFDIELERLRRLWAGAAPGSLGSIPEPPVPPAKAVAQPSKPLVVRSGKL